jgi:NNP family nitrate/nitrite transporter-like MFS transporter
MKLIVLSAPPRRTGAYQAFFAAIYSSGNVVAYLLIPRLIGFGWQWSYILPAGMGLFLLCALPVVRLEPPPATPSSQMSLRGVISIKAGWALGLYHALSWGSMINLGNWIPSLLEEVWTGHGAARLALGGALVLLIAGVGRLCGGIILLRFSPLVIANGSILVLGVLFFSLFAIPIPEIILPLAMLAAWFATVNYGALFHLASRSTSTDSLATFLGFMTALANLGAVLFTLTFGWFKDYLGSFTWGFFLLTVLSFLSLSWGRRVLRH